MDSLSKHRLHSNVYRSREIAAKISVVYRGLISVTPGLFLLPVMSERVVDSAAAKKGPYVAVATLGAAVSAVLTTPNHAECGGVSIDSVLFVLHPY